MNIELKLHDIGVTALLSRIAASAARHEAIGPEDIDTVNQAITHAAVLHNMRVVKIEGGLLSLEPKEQVAS